MGDGWALQAQHRRQAARADRLQAGIEGSGGGGQAEIAMSRQGRGIQGRTGGWVQAIPPRAARRLVTFISHRS